MIIKRPGSSAHTKLASNARHATIDEPTPVWSSLQAIEPLYERDFSADLPLIAPTTVDPATGATSSVYVGSNRQSACSDTSPISLPVDSMPSTLPEAKLETSTIVVQSDPVMPSPPLTSDAALASTIENAALLPTAGSPTLTVAGCEGDEEEVEEEGQLENTSVRLEDNIEDEEIDGDLTIEAESGEWDDEVPPSPPSPPSTPSSSPLRVAYEPKESGGDQEVSRSSPVLAAVQLHTTVEVEVTITEEVEAVVWQSISTTHDINHDQEDTNTAVEFTERDDRIVEEPHSASSDKVVQTPVDKANNTSPVSEAEEEISPEQETIPSPDQTGSPLLEAGIAGTDQSYGVILGEEDLERTPKEGSEGSSGEDGVGASEDGNITDLGVDEDWDDSGEEIAEEEEKSLDIVDEADEDVSKGAGGEDDVPESSRMSVTGDVSVETDVPTLPPFMDDRRETLEEDQPETTVHSTLCHAGGEDAVAEVEASTETTSGPADQIVEELSLDRPVVAKKAGERIIIKIVDRGRVIKLEPDAELEEQEEVFPSATPRVHSTTLTLEPDQASSQPEENSQSQTPARSTHSDAQPIPSPITPSIYPALSSEIPSKSTSVPIAPSSTSASTQDVPETPVQRHSETIHTLEAMLQRRNSSTSSIAGTSRHKPSRLSNEVLPSPPHNRNLPRRSLGAELRNALLAEGAEGMDREGLTSVVEVSSLDPKAAARAAAILKLVS
jgi:hypothetical protein